MIRTDPVIATLNVNDLNQRYSGSFLHYNGKVQRCNGFRVASNSTIQIHLEIADGLVIEKFKPDKVNVWRPDAQWLGIQLKGGSHVPCYFSYRMVRQFCRGFSNENCGVFCPTGSMVPLNRDLISAVFNNPLIKNPKIRYEELWNRVNGLGWHILNPAMCVAHNGRGSYLFFRSTQIASLGPKGMTITHPHFEQEINETIVQ